VFKLRLTTSHKERRPAEELTAPSAKVANGGKYVSASFAEKLGNPIWPDPKNPCMKSLSDREYRVMWLLASASTSTILAAEMFLSPSHHQHVPGPHSQENEADGHAALVRYAVKASASFNPAGRPRRRPIKD